MNKTIGELLKNIRIANNLTQKKFADKFCLTEKTISNYETGKRNPDIDFIQKVCENFNVSLDYFFSLDSKESLTQNLIISSRNGKCALYDKAQGIYLTQFNYDTIIISPINKHILIKWNKNDEIAYSAIINNNGEIQEFENLLFGHRGHFTIAGTIIALNKKKQKLCIINSNGEEVSKSFVKIFSKSGKNLIKTFFAYDSNNKITLLDMFGKQIDCPFDDEFNLILKSNDELKFYLSNYGDIKIVSPKIFSNLCTYRIALESFCEFLLNKISNANEFCLCSIIKTFLNDLESNSYFYTGNPSEKEQRFYNEFSLKHKLNKIIKNNIALDMIMKTKRELDKKLKIVS